MPLATRILLVDDDATLRAAMRGLLRSEPDFAFAGEAADGATAVRLALELTPDVVLMDVRMPGPVDGIEATRQIVGNARVTPPPAVIGLSGSGEYAREMLDAGAATFVAKGRVDEPVNAIKAATRAVRGG